MRLVALAFSLAATSALARADEPPESVPPDTPEEEPTPTEPVHEDTAADVDGAPRPGMESGRIDDAPSTSAARQLARGVLVFPRAAFEIVLAPVRGSLWVYDRYRLKERWLRFFYNDDRTIGLQPTAAFESGFGLRVGARFVYRDIWGQNEHLSLKATTGGVYWTTLAATARSGERFGRLELMARAEFLRRPRDRFFGIGNADETETVGVTVDPTMDPTAISTRYRQQTLRAALTADVRLASDLHVLASGALSDTEFGDSDYGTSIEEIYMTGPLVGFDEGVRQAYGELELRWDSRGPYSMWDSSAMDSTGWLASIYAGRAAVENTPDFWRLGVDAQYFLHIGTGPRMFVARLHGETVSGDVDEVPFDELPKLGGAALLRGYATDRFRDRAAALGTLEYRWDLAQILMTSLFVDVGKVAPSIGDLGDGDIRVGYGIGFDAYTKRQYIGRIAIATSIDGGWFFNLSFDPTFDIESRVERR